MENGFFGRGLLNENLFSASNIIGSKRESSAATNQPYLVRMVQVALNVVSNANLVVDGDVGSLTTAAIKKYTGSKSGNPAVGYLEADGLVELFKEFGQKASISANVGQGQPNKYKDVLVVQTAINFYNKKYDTLLVDGIYGGQTQGAISKIPGYEASTPYIWDNRLKALLTGSSGAVKDAASSSSSSSEKKSTSSYGYFEKEEIIKIIDEYIAAFAAKDHAGRIPGYKKGQSYLKSTELDEIKRTYKTSQDLFKFLVGEGISWYKTEKDPMAGIKLDRKLMDAIEKIYK
jgi:peptidoglycan hydrolase-like protein with peptidoglycan-binding domain